MENTDNTIKFDIHSLIKPYLSKWHWFLLSVISCLILGVVFIKISLPVYNIKSAVLIKDAKKSLGGGMADMGVLEGLSGFGGMGTNSIENELEVFKTKKLARDIVSINHLQTTIFSLKGIRKKELFGEDSPITIHMINEKKNQKFPKKRFLFHLENNESILESEEYEFKQNVKFGKMISLPFANIIITKNKIFDKEKAGKIGKVFEINFSTLENSASQLQKMLRIDLADKDATVINLSLDYSHVDKAKTIISTLIDSYNKDAILDKNSESQKTKDFIDDRINKISKELGNVELEKEKFKSENKITDIMTEAKIDLEASAKARQKEIEINTQLEITNDLISYLNRQQIYQPIPSNIGLESVEAGNAISAYNKIVIDRDRILETATAQNPLVIDLSKQINSMRLSVTESLLKNKVGLQLALDEYQNEQNKISSKIVKIPNQEKLFRNIERQQQIKESLYLLLLQKREETAISLAVVAPKARVVDPVYVSDIPVAPKKIIILLMAFIIGALIPLSIIYLKELLNDKLVAKSDIKTLSSIPIVAEIPAIKKNTPHLVKHNDFSPLAEAFRILMTNMGFMLEANDDCKTIMVTSSIKGEGKTFVSMNLALTLSNTSNKVLIIGSDIRNPQLQRYNENNTNIKGLTEFLYDNNLNTSDIIQQLSLSSNCDIIYSGIVPPNPTELLKNGRLGLLINDLKKNYQYIIIDTAPLLLVTDTFTITKYSDLVLYVTRADYSNKSLIDFADDSKKDGKIGNVAFVLNDVKKQNFGYGNKYGYGYNI